MALVAAVALVASPVLVAPAAAQAAPKRLPFNGVPTPPHVTIVYASCPDTGEGTCTDLANATVYLDSRDRFSRQHELGHLADAQLLDDPERSALEPLLSVPAWTLWENGTAHDCLDRACPSEPFADAYATCRLGMLSEGGRRGRLVSSWETAYGYWPETNAAQRRACRAVRRYLSASSTAPS